MHQQKRKSLIPERNELHAGFCVSYNALYFTFGAYRREGLCIRVVTRGHGCLQMTHHCKPVGAESQCPTFGRSVLLLVFLSMKELFGLTALYVFG